MEQREGQRRQAAYQRGHGDAAQITPKHAIPALGVRRPPFGHRHQRRHRGKRHLESRLSDRLGPPHQQHRRRQRHAPHGQRRPVQQHRRQRHRQHHKSPQRRRRRAADHQIEQRRHQRRARRPFLDRIIQRQSRKRRQQRPHKPEQPAAHQRHVQPRDRQHMRKPRIAQCRLVLVADATAFPGDQRGGDRPPRSGQCRTDARRHARAQVVDCLRQALRWPRFIQHGHRMGAAIDEPRRADGLEKGRPPKIGGARLHGRRRRRQAGG